MSTLPGNGIIYDAGNTVTVTQMKGHLEALRDVIAEILGGASSEYIVISSGSITPAVGIVRVGTEGAAGSDDLDNIVLTNHPDGRVLFLRAQSSAQTVVLKHMSGGSGQIYLSDATDLSLSDFTQWIILYQISSTWYEVGRFYGNNKADARTHLGLGTSAVEDVGTGNGNIPQLTATGLPAISGEDLTALPAIATKEYILIRDEKADTTNGGTFISGAWRQRDLNTEVIDEGNNVTLAGDQITVTVAGDYYVRIHAPAVQVTYHRARFYETTATISALYSQNAVADISIIRASSNAVITGKITVTSGNISASQNIFEVQHQCTNSLTNTGFGVHDNMALGNEIYTIVEMWRVD